MKVRPLLCALLGAFVPLPATASFADVNSNGLSDVWEKLFNGDQLFPSTFNPEADADGDRISNLDESVAGTDPFDGKPPEGFLQVLVNRVPAVFVTPPGGGEPELVTPEVFILSWPALSGKQYTLLGSPDLAAASWTPVGDPRIGQDYWIQVPVSPKHPDGSTPAAFFWRLTVNDLDTDGDGFTDHDEISKGTDPVIADRDDDGLPDSWEILAGLDPDDDGSILPSNGGSGDPDDDDLINLDEFAFDGDPHDADTDDDELGDFSEAWTHGTLLDDADSDDDDLTDREEVEDHFTDPWMWDTDEDLLSDKDEIDLHETDPLDPDTDDDSMRDDWEVAEGIDPLVANAPADPDGDLLTNLQEYVLRLHPLDDDSDDDLILDGQEDHDGDKLTNFAEFNTHLTNPKLFDTDGDRLPDGWEVLYGIDPLNSVSANGADGDIDTDGIFNPGDGLSNLEEYLNNTDPTQQDTDGDGKSDADEIDQGSDPDDPSDGGAAPADPLVEVPFKVYGDYASWEMTVRGEGPRDQRQLLVIMPGVGEPEVKSLKLRKNNKYKVTLRHTGSRPDKPETWYCWEARVGGKPEVQTFADYQPNRLAGVAEFFSVGGGNWIVDNRPGLFTAHNDRNNLNGGNPAVSLASYLVPVAIKDNAEAKGVDDVSVSADPSDPGFQEKFWIMAQNGGAEFNNDMHFLIHPSPSAELDMTCPDVVIDPATITLDSGEPLVNWRGTVTESGDKQPQFQIGQANDVVDLPIGVKCMKRRTVHVKVFKVTEQGDTPVTNNTADIVPDEGALESYLSDEVFGPQINTVFEVDIADEALLIDWEVQNDPQSWMDVGDPGENSADQQLFVDAVSDGNGELPADIVVFLVGSNVALGGFATGVTNQAAKVCWVLGDIHNGGPADPNPYNSVDDVMRTIAHEIGHVFLGYGHPDLAENAGVAPLEGTDRTRRLMVSGTGGGANPGILLVKAEWDAAEAWLKPNMDDLNQ